ncbi:putative F-box domain-containing protein [Arabidopsis thaliana]
MAARSRIHQFHRFSLRRRLSLCPAKKGDVKGFSFLESKNQSKKEAKPSFADLTLCLLEVIISQLDLKDNIRASAVCKTWREAGLYVRKVDKPPWLMYLPKRGNLFELYDPLHQKMYTLNLPELAKSTVCYSRDGWLLMRKTISREMFFFNPFTRKLINVPKCTLSYDAIAFSCAPTSGTCVLLAFKHVSYRITTTSTCHPKATEWVTEDLQFHRRFRSETLNHSNVVYAKRRFYCLDGQGSLYYFDPSSRRWDFSYTYLLPCPYISDRFSYQYERKKKRIFLAVRKGVFFKIFTCDGEKPIVHKLEDINWEEINSTTIDGLTIFTGLYSSEVRLNLPWMRNSVYFPRLRFNVKRCVSYSLDEERYYPRKQWQEQEDLCPIENLWIRPPKKAVDFM